MSADNAEIKEAKISEAINSCMDEAWAFGTSAANAVGGENTTRCAAIAYAATDTYYQAHCL
jgi:hypothetical protein